MSLEANRFLNIKDNLDDYDNQLRIIGIIKENNRLIEQQIKEDNSIEKTLLLRFKKLFSDLSYSLLQFRENIFGSDVQDLIANISGCIDEWNKLVIFLSNNMKYEKLSEQNQTFIDNKINSLFNTLSKIIFALKKDRNYKDVINIIRNLNVLKNKIQTNDYSIITLRELSVTPEIGVDEVEEEEEEEPEEEEEEEEEPEEEPEEEEEEPEEEEPEEEEPEEEEEEPEEEEEEEEEEPEPEPKEEFTQDELEPYLDAGLSKEEAIDLLRYIEERDIDVDKEVEEFEKEEEDKKKEIDALIVSNKELTDDVLNSLSFDDLKKRGTHLRIPRLALFKNKQKLIDKIKEFQNIRSVLEEQKNKKKKEEKELKKKIKKLGIKTEEELGKMTKQELIDLMIDKGYDKSGLSGKPKGVIINRILDEQEYVLSRS